jgi:hypothetical protein
MAWRCQRKHDASTAHLYCALRNVQPTFRGWRSGVVAVAGVNSGVIPVVVCRCAGAAEPRRVLRDSYKRMLRVTKNHGASIPRSLTHTVAPMSGV